MPLHQYAYDTRFNFSVWHRPEFDGDALVTLHERARDPLTGGYLDSPRWMYYDFVHRAVIPRMPDEWGHDDTTEEGFSSEEDPVDVEGVGATRYVVQTVPDVFQPVSPWVPYHLRP